MLLFIPLFLIGCVSRVVPLKRTYVPGAYEKLIEKPKEQVWNSLLDILPKNGLPVRLKESGSGLIKCEPVKLAWTYENKKGKLDDPQAYVVVERVIYKNKLLPLTSVTGEWDIRLKESKEGQTYLVVSLVNLRYTTPTEPSYQPFLQAIPTSTGVFERTLYEQVK